MNISEELENLIPEWLNVPDLVEELGLDVRRVRSLLDARAIIGVRRGENNALAVPADFVQDGRIVDSLGGTLNVLADAGYSDAEALRWLFTPDETLPGTPMQALIDGRKTEIRRRAQTLGW